MKSLNPSSFPNEIRTFLEWLVEFSSQEANVRRVFLFGSFAKGESGVNSDIDLAVELSDTGQFEELKQQIENNPESLRRVDVVDLLSISGDFR